MNEYKGKILPPDHPISRKIISVVTRILEANKIGGTLRILHSAGALTLELQSVDSDKLNSDGGAQDAGTASRRQWDLIVVDDITELCASAGIGESCVQSVHYGRFKWYA